MENTITLLGCVVATILVCWIFGEVVRSFGLWVWSKSK